MVRTAHRPLVSKTLSPSNVLIFSILLLCCGTFFLITFANTLTLTLTLIGALGYAFVYTLYLKHKTPQNIVLGGLYGSLPPLLGWCSLSNSLDPQALLLPLIIFVWTPPHFWALAIDRVDDYQKARIPMLPVTHGITYTSLFILFYNLLLLAVTLLPFVTGMLGFFYLCAALFLNLLYFFYNIRLFYQPSLAMNSFKFSIVYLYVLFVVMLFDRMI